MPDSERMRLPGGWAQAKLGDLVRSVSVRGHQAQTKDYGDAGQWPIVDQGKSKVAGWTDAYEPVRAPLPLVLFGDHTREVKWVSEPFVVGADGVKLLVPADGRITTSFLHLLVSAAAARLPSMGYARHFGALCDEVVLFPVEQREQERLVEIANDWSFALSGLDGVIVAKTSLKRDAMEKLLSRGDELVRLGDVFVERDERGLDLPLAGITASGGVVPRDSIDRRDTSSEDKSSYKVIRPGDIGYNTMRMWQGVSGLSDLSGLISPAYTVITPVEERIDPVYAAQLFKLPRMVHKFWRYSQGLVDDTLQLRFAHFAEIEVELPEIGEQQRVGAYLQSLDRELAILRSQADRLLEQKLALMRKLLTGTWRLAAPEAEAA